VTVTGVHRKMPPRSRRIDEEFPVPRPPVSFFMPAFNSCLDLDNVLVPGSAALLGR
jgi:hypothetical protein